MILLRYVFLALALGNATYATAQHSIFIKNWKDTYLFYRDGSLRVCNQDLHILANLFYFSYLRSHSTLHAQEKILQALRTLNQCWQNITHTRLNPSQQEPHQEIIFEESKDIFALYTQYHEINKTYAHATEAIIKGSLLANGYAKEAIEHVRKQARIIIQKELLDIKKHAGSFFNYIAAQYPKRKTIVDYALDYIPMLSVSSFIKANRAHNLLSVQTWRTWYQLQEAGNYTWQIIEQARADFYQECYVEIMTIIDEHKIPDDYRTIMFDQEGIINKSKRNNYLSFLRK
jgi:hypothetical protein